MFGNKQSKPSPTGSDRGRNLRVESLEPRCLLAGDTFLINFQFDEAPTPNSYFRDVGALFGDRGNGLTYGWSSDHTDVSRDRGVEADQRLDTLIHFHVNQYWELELANGVYEVTAVVGDPLFNDGIHTLNVEGVSFFDNIADTDTFMSQTMLVTVADGRLTLDQGGGAEKATRIDYLHVVGQPIAPNTPPAVPNISEPEVDGQEASPVDVHMEAVGFSDTDGDQHLSTDWAIWAVGPSAEPVWTTLGITGAERLHTHLGDGFFENSHAGRQDLLPETDFELRVRFRDDAGAVSNYASRLFRTGAASTVFAMEIEDIATTPAPTWEEVNGGAIDLPTASAALLQVQSATGELLLAIAASGQTGNAVANPATLSAHVDVRILISAESPGLNVGPSNLVFTDGDGQLRTVFLPSLSLTGGATVTLWVAIDGSTYYGTAGQTEPDFSNLARGAGNPIPFIARQPGYVVEEVASGLQLPVNLAFIANPGLQPNDPLFYVNELYGTVKVVTNAGTVSDYATELLNFNPTGNFPGSGEQGLAGLVVDPTTGDLFVSRVTDSDGLPGGAHHPQVLKLTSTDGGFTMATETVILDMPGESQGQSHQISNVSIGPDGMLYVHNGDGFDANTAQNLNSYRGKILRMDFSGNAPTDNPFYDASDGINARDYVFAYGFRNPFGGAWRASDNLHYEVENGPSLDRFAQVVEGVNYQWNGSNASLLTHSIYNWNPAHAPVNIAFVQPETFAGSLFPADQQDRAFVSESGPTYAQGPQTRGKRIVSFQLDAGGNVVGGPETLVEYVGVGRATVVGLTTGPDGLYFTDLYKDLDAQSPIEAGARVLRVRYIAGSTADFDLDGDVDSADLARWKSGFHTTMGATVAQGDADADGDVDGFDFLSWQRHYTASQSASASIATSVSPSANADSLELGGAHTADAALASDGAPANDSALANDGALAKDWAPTDERAPAEFSTAHRTARNLTTGDHTILMPFFDTFLGFPANFDALPIPKAQGEFVPWTWHTDPTLALATSIERFSPSRHAVAESIANDLKTGSRWLSEAEHDSTLTDSLAREIDDVFAYGDFAG